MGQPAGPFKIILVEYRRTASPDVLGDPNKDRLQSEVAKLFGVDDDTASNILSAMPIVVLDGLDAPTAGVVRDRLHYLTQFGCKITTTDEVSDSIPRVNWPELPPIARVDPEELSRSSSAGAAVAPRGPGLLCPSCGTSFRLVAETNARGHSHSSSATAAPQRQQPRATRTAAPAPAPAPALTPAAVPTPSRSPAPTPRGLEVPLGDDDWLAPGSRPAPAPAQTQRPPTRRNSGRFDNPALMGRSPAPATPPPPAQDELQVEFGAMSSGTHKTLSPPQPATNHRGQPSRRDSGPSKRDRLREAMGGSSDLSGLPGSSEASPLDMIEDSQVVPPNPLDESSLEGLDPLEDPLSDLEAAGFGPGDSGSLLGKPPSARLKRSARSDELEDLDDLLLDSEGSSASADMPSLQDSQDPSLEDVLGMFGPEDEQPLDDGSGLDPLPLDLSSASQAGTSSSPFDDEVSDILEPLNPEEARQIMRSHSGRQPSQQRASTASHLRLHEEPSDLEPLDPSEAFAILGGGDRGRSKPAKSKSRGVPHAATDEDVSRVESRRSQKKKSAKHTDPFGRARRGEDDDGASKRTRSSRTKRESTRAASVKRSGRNGRPKAASGRSKAPSGRSKRPSGKTRRPGGAPPNGKGDHGLVLSRLSDPDKKDRAAELIAEIKGCSLDEANRLTDRTIIPVLKGVTREVAEYHLDRFKDIDIAGRVTTRQRS